MSGARFERNRVYTNHLRIKVLDFIDCQGRAAWCKVKQDLGAVGSYCALTKNGVFGTAVRRHLRALPCRCATGERHRNRPVRRSAVMVDGALRRPNPSILLRPFRGSGRAPMSKSETPRRHTPAPKNGTGNGDGNGRGKAAARGAVPGAAPAPRKRDEEVIA